MWQVEVVVVLPFSRGRINIRRVFASLQRGSDKGGHQQVPVQGRIDEVKFVPSKGSILRNAIRYTLLDSTALSHEVSSERKSLLLSRVSVGLIQSVSVQHSITSLWSGPDNIYGSSWMNNVYRLEVVSVQFMHIPSHYCYVMKLLHHVHGSHRRKLVTMGFFYRQILSRFSEG